MARDYRKLSKRALLERIAQQLDEQGKTLSQLDDSVSNYLTAVRTELDELRAKLAQAVADDANAAEVRADVEENIARLEAATTELQANDPPAEPPADGGETGGDGTDGETTPVTDPGAGAAGIPSGGEPGEPDLGGGKTL